MTICTTSLERYSQRHYSLCRRVEAHWKDMQQLRPEMTLDQLVSEYASAAIRAHQRRDHISGCFAAQAAHLCSIAHKPVDSLGPIGPKPTHETQVRPLAAEGSVSCQDISLSE
jgi:hypothetical protein